MCLPPPATPLSTVPCWFTKHLCVRLALALTVAVGQWHFKLKGAAASHLTGGMQGAAHTAQGLVDEVQPKTCVGVGRVALVSLCWLMCEVMVLSVFVNKGLKGIKAGVMRALCRQPISKAPFRCLPVPPLPPLRTCAANIPQLRYR